MTAPEHPTNKQQNAPESIGTADAHHTRGESGSSRFAFGQNWQQFLHHIDEERIDHAIASIQKLLRVHRLDGQRFLDIGCGSGLFSLAAVRLGARVTSIDFDESSVWCTEQLRDRFASDANDWEIRTGDVLDDASMQTLGRFDVVYSWGVLHHTGDLQRALLAASGRVCEGGLFAIAIYNDQGGASRRWLFIKRLYHRLPKRLRPAFVFAVAAPLEIKFAFVRLLRGQNPSPLPTWRAKRQDRGMSAWTDWVDWVGGLPFEVATAEDIIMPMIRQNFHLHFIETTRGWGCNQYTFRRQHESTTTTK